MRAAGRRIAALTRRDLAVLELERQWGQSPDVLGAKLAAAQQQLGLSSGAYALIVNALIDDPAAQAHDALTIHRLREVRESRRATQAADAEARAAEQAI